MNKYNSDIVQAFNLKVYLRPKIQFYILIMQRTSPL